jgi:hypothetical protein
VAQAVDLPRATNVTPEVLRVTGRLVEALWQADDGGPHGTGRPYPYRKAGVMLLDLTRAKPEQGHLFLPETPAADALMDALDAVNRRFGKRTVTLAAEGTGGAGGRHDTETGQDWAMRRQHKSPAYTTRWTDLPIFHAG